MIELSANDNVLFTTFEGKPNDEDYEKLIVFLKELEREYDTLRWYFEIKNTESWNPTGNWKTADFNLKNKESVEKLALVGDKEMKSVMKDLVKDFHNAEVRFFSTEEKGEALLFVE